MGERATVIRLEEDGALLDYLERIGLQIHEPIEVQAVEDYEGPMKILQGAKSIHISYKAATQVFVERHEDAKDKRK